MQIWGIVDQDRNVLYGSNDRAEVDAEYERQVAKDPRLRRVLEVTELELEFPRSEEPFEEGEQHTICVLPWLPLDDPIAFGSVRLEHWSAVRRRVDDPARGTAAALLHNYRDIHNRPVDPPICWFADRSPIAQLGREDLDRMGLHIRLLGLAGITENAYLHHFEQLNATHCRPIFQFFRSGRSEVSLVRRRRDGHWQSPWRASEILFVTPLAAQGRPTAAGRPNYLPLYRQDFLDGLADCVEADDQLTRAISQSVVPFLRGNELDEYGTAEQDIVWLVAALEQLFGVAYGRQTGRRGAELHMSIGSSFSEWWEVPDRRRVRRWARQLYNKRNEIHGGQSTATSWQDWAHALLATVVYPLAIKVLLTRGGRYELNDFDLDEILAFPARVGCVEGRGELDQQAVGEQWQQALYDASLLRAHSKALGHLRREEDSSE
jgi:hypothetical protein